MARKVKCPECKKLNDKENTIKHKNRYYCPSCLEKKKERVKKNTDGWIELYEYIYDLTGKPPTGKMYKQLSEYRKDPYNFTNDGIRLTLYYFHELLGNPIKDDTLGIVPYVYEKAKQEYIKNMEIHKYNSSVDFQEKIKYVKINPTSINPINKIINFDELEEFNE